MYQRVQRTSPPVQLRRSAAAKSAAPVQVAMHPPRPIFLPPLQANPGAPVQLVGKSRKRRKQSAKKKAERAREMQAREEQARRDSIAAFATASARGRERILRKYYKIEPGLTPEQETARHRQLAKEFGFSKSLENLPGAKLGMGRWHGGQEEIIGGHHKLPKRTLAFLYSKMTEAQREKMRAKLHLDANAGHKALAKLRSNIIPRGPLQVSPDKRADDADHREDDDDVDEPNAEGVDAVVDISGSMTPRSRTYVSLAAHAKYINKRLQGLQDDAPKQMTNSEADTTIEHLQGAEVLHHQIEGSLDAADYGDDFWTPVGNGKYVKGRAERSDPNVNPQSVAAFDEAHEERQQEMRQRAREARAREEEAARQARAREEEAARQAAIERRRQEEEGMRALRERWARDSERARLARLQNPQVENAPRNIIGKSGRFF